LWLVLRGSLRSTGTGGLLQSQHISTLLASTANKHIRLKQIRISLSQANVFFPLNKAGGGSSSDENTIFLTAKVESARWHVTCREQSPQEQNRYLRASLQSEAHTKCFYNFPQLQV